MEIIEKQTIKEVPVDGNYGYGYGRKDINGKANAGLTLGIIGTALGAWALFGNRRSSIIGDVEIGGGTIGFSIPLTDKKLVFDTTDLESFKEMLITKE